MRISKSCLGWGDHSYRRHGDYVVCAKCGHRVRVVARKPWFGRKREGDKD